MVAVARESFGILKSPSVIQAVCHSKDARPSWRSRAAFRALNWNLLGVLAGAVGLGAIATSSGLTDAIADWVARTSGDSVAILVVLVAVVAVAPASLPLRTTSADAAARRGRR